MRKAEFVDAISKKSGLSKKDSQVALEAVLDAIQDSLTDSDGVNFIGFGSFTVTKREARKTKVPGTDRVVDVPASKVVKFKPGKQLKEAVANS